MLRYLSACIFFSISAYFAPPIDPYFTKNMSTTLIPDASAEILKIPFGVFDTSKNALVFITQKTSNSLSYLKDLTVQAIYLTDLKNAGTADLNVTAKPPKMILKFKSAIITDVIISSGLTPAEVPDIIGGISLQMTSFYAKRTNPKLDIKKSWGDIQTSINRSSASKELKNAFISEINKKIVA